MVDAGPTRRWTRTGVGRCRRRRWPIQRRWVSRRLELSTWHSFGHLVAAVFNNGEQGWVGRVPCSHMTPLMPLQIHQPEKGDTPAIKNERNSNLETTLRPFIGFWLGLDILLRAFGRYLAFSTLDFPSLLRVDCEGLVHINQMHRELRVELDLRWVSRELEPSLRC